MIRSTLNASKLNSRAVSRASGAIRTMAGKEIKFGVEGRAAMLRGVNLLADAVQVRSNWESKSFSSPKGKILHLTCDTMGAEWKHRCSLAQVVVVFHFLNFAFLISRLPR